MVFDNYNYKVIVDIASLKDVESILVFIEQDFEVKQEKLSNWFSSKTVNKEVLIAEHKYTFVNGKISECETLEYNRAVNRYYERSFLSRFVFLTIETKDFPLLGYTHKESGTIDNEEYFRHCRCSDFNKKFAGGKYNQYGDLIYLSGTLQGVYYEEVYEYKYDEHHNWTEYRVYKNGKYQSLKIRQFKYK